MWWKCHEIEHPGKTHEGAKHDVFVWKYVYEILSYFLLSNTNYNYMILKCIDCVLLSADIANFEQLFTNTDVSILRGSDVKVTSCCQQIPIICINIKHCDNRMDYKYVCDTNSLETVRNLAILANKITSLKDGFLSPLWWFQALNSIFAAIRLPLII